MRPADIIPIDRNALILAGRNTLPLLFLFLLANHCAAVRPVNGIEILKGQARFNSELGLLKNAKGVLPETFTNQLNNPHIIKKNSISWNEFFVYDRQNILIILSPAPMYFLKLQSDQFYHHVEIEYNQLARGLSGDDKEFSSLSSFQEVGDFVVGLYFTPEEIRYAQNSRRIEGANGTNRPRPDIWRLLEASQTAMVYVPDFEEDQLLGNLKFDVKEKKTRFVYTSNLMTDKLSSDHVVNEPYHFSFIMGKNLQKTNCLLDQQTFFRPAEEHALVQNFIAFFSVPLGNARQCSSHGNETQYCLAGERRDFLNMKDGIVILYRGDLSRFENFFSKDGFNLTNPMRKLSSSSGSSSYKCKAPK